MTVPSNLRVLIVHDWIMSWAGSERVVEQLLLLFPQADVVVGLQTRQPLPENAVTRRATETWLKHIPFARRHHRWLLPLYPAAFATLDTRGYDLVISSAHAFAKAVRTDERTPHLCYCHSPPRYLWDLEETYRERGGRAGTLLSLAAPLLRAADRAAARGVDRFVANSRYIAERIRRSYGRSAQVVYPPVSAKATGAHRGAREDVLLSLGRLVPYKRVDLAIEAANALGARLVIAGDGPERRRLEGLAGPTVTFLGAVSEATAGDLMERCQALVFCAEEDFGITPVEANAHGLPVIAYGAGGTLESMRAGASALFFDTQTVPALSDAIARARVHPWREADIRENAARFSPERFRAGMAEEVRRLLGTTGTGTVAQ